MHTSDSGWEDTLQLFFFGCDISLPAFFLPTPPLIFFSCLLQYSKYEESILPPISLSPTQNEERSIVGHRAEIVKMSVNHLPRRQPKNEPRAV